MNFFVKYIICCFGFHLFQAAKSLTFVHGMTSTSVLEDYIQIIDPPAIIEGNRVSITVKYQCTGTKIVGIEFVSDVKYGSYKKIFHKLWKCNRSVDSTHPRIKNVRLNIPAEFAYNYNTYNRNIKFSSNTQLRAWVLDRKWWPACFHKNICFAMSFVKVVHNTEIPHPFSRPFIPMTHKCTTWANDIMALLSSYGIPKCPKELEIVETIFYPVVLGGKEYGVYRTFKPFVNPDLEEERRKQITQPRFTICMYLYILEYCSNVNAKLCSLMHHFTWKGEFRTIVLLLTSAGQLHVQVHHSDNHQSAGLSYGKVPKYQWIRLILIFNINTWKVVINHGKDFNETITDNEFTHSGAPVYFDDTEGLFSFGGSEIMTSFQGYIGHATVYRNKAMDINKIPMLSKYHPMFELKLARREEICSTYMKWVQDIFQIYKYHFIEVLGKESCRNPFAKMLADVQNGTSMEARCPIRRSGWRHVNNIVKKMVWSHHTVDYTLIADQLYQIATSLLDVKIENIQKVFPLLKQVACYGHTEAMYYVAVILNNGIYTNKNEIQSLAYLMQAALYSHRLSVLALGHKHRYGIDGVPLDLEQSYVYYKLVADTTRADKEIHKDTDVYTESIRLIDEIALGEQMDENGDLFQWLTLQAKQGVLTAQNRVGRSLFWGAQGLKRNLQAAVEYFKLSAESGDSQSQYDYGIVLLRGQGVNKDVDAGLQQLHKAAEQANPAAINALGWHAMVYEHDLAKAAQYFENAHKMGNVDATNNLGIMYLHGTYPGQAQDADKALDYFNDAGVRNQMDAAVSIAFVNIKGTDRRPRDVYTAVEWARFVAEKNPAIGFILRKALQNYRKDKQDVSLFYYILAADAGVEIGSFNTAWLCEANQNGITSFIEKECIWSKYNISTQREIHFVSSYALIKMGDLFWYGCDGHRDPAKAATYYAQAVHKNDPQAVFNLALMAEEGFDIPNTVLNEIRVPMRHRTKRSSLLEYLYSRCKESGHSEAYISCSIALWRTNVLDIWHNYSITIKMASVAVVAASAAISSIIAIRTHIRGHREVTDNI